MKSRRDMILVTVCLAQVMVFIDISIVNVALPEIRSSLDFSAIGLQWVVNAYTLTFAGFLMLAGRATDLIRRRRVFLGGITLFTVASLGCALAESQVLLIGARAAQGFGAAVLSAAGLAIITSSLKKGRRRNRALGLWAAMGGVGGSAGVLIGGALTQAFGWPAIFIINVPVGLVVLFIGRQVIPDEPVIVAGRKFDAAGAALISASLTAIVYGIVRTDTLGWSSPGTLGPLALGIVLLCLFALVEGRLATDPLVPLAIFKNPALRAANMVVALLIGAMFAMWYFVSLYLQEVKGEDAMVTGISFLPMTLTMFAASSSAPRLMARLGVRTTLGIGMSLTTIGFLLLATVQVSSAYADAILPGGMLTTLGTGWSLVPATIVAVKDVPPEQNGLASGIVNTSRLLSGTLGLAVLTTIATSRTNHLLDGGTAELEALTSGYRVAFLVGAGLCMVGMIVGVSLLRGRADSAAPRPV